MANTDSSSSSNGASSALDHVATGTKADPIADDVDSPVSPGDTEEASGWLESIRNRLGLASPSLRDVLQEALHDQTDNSSGFSSAERDMLTRTLRFGTLRVEDVMVPRADIVAIDEKAAVGRLMALFQEVGHSRIPVFNETLDDLRGMIHIKDVLAWLIKKKRTKTRSGQKPVGKTAGIRKGNGKATDDADGNVTSIAAIGVTEADLAKPIAATRLRRDILFVPPSMPAINLLLRMQALHVHLAMVVDEYGGIDGLVSIEDLIEEVVGEIEDEHDDNSEEIIQPDPVLGHVASARISISDLEQFLACKMLNDDDDEDIDTLGGLVFSLVGRVPVRGEVVPHPSGYEFEVLDADPRRIKRLRIIPRVEPASDDAGVGISATATSRKSVNDGEPS